MLLAPKALPAALAPKGNRVKKAIPAPKALSAWWDLLVRKVEKVTLARKVQWGQPGR